MLFSLPGIPSMPTHPSRLNSEAAVFVEPSWSFSEDFTPLASVTIVLVTDLNFNSNHVNVWGHSVAFFFFWPIFRITGS